MKVTITEERGLVKIWAHLVEGDDASCVGCGKTLEEAMDSPIYKRFRAYFYK